MLLLDNESLVTISVYWLILGAAMGIILLKTNAPYGRFSSVKWGAQINNRLAWFLMELPSLLLFPLFFILGKGDKTIFLCLTATLWLIHYTRRVLIFPFQIKTKGKKMPLLIMFFALFFNLVNSYLNGLYLGNVNTGFDNHLMIDPRFLAGFLLFFTGMVINIHSDRILIRLRKMNGTDYKIPFGGLYRFISCPNYLGEILEWSGFAIACWNLPALSFAVWSMANLIPRALSYHKWYNSFFNDYPKNRKALIPFVL